jgi:microcystin-dependent protein
MQPFIGEIRLFAGTFAPVGWLMCDGSAQPIPGNETLYTLIGTTFGGDGVTTFNMPDLRGRVPLGQGMSTSGTMYSMGQVGGTETAMLATANLPPHGHNMVTSTAAGDNADPTGRVLAVAPTDCKFYFAAPSAPPTALNSGHMLAGGGGGQPHQNLQPYQALGYIIATVGLFPSQS